jgi:hypothetical protein
LLLLLLLCLILFKTSIKAKASLIQLTHFENSSSQGWKQSAAKAVAGSTASATAAHMMMRSIVEEGFSWVSVKR